jgi:hypothetical protein
MICSTKGRPAQCCCVHSDNANSIREADNRHAWLLQPFLSCMPEPHLHIVLSATMGTMPWAIDMTAGSETRCERGGRHVHWASVLKPACH